MQSLPEDDLRDFFANENAKLNEKFDEVLSLAIEQYLGRPFNAVLDAERIHAVSVIGSNDISYFVDDKLIGKMTQTVAYNNDDFIHNKMSIMITFMPVGDVIVEKCPKCKNNSLVWEQYNTVDCHICKWRPVSIPWDEDDI